MIDVIGIGAPLMDHLMAVSDSYLDQVPGKKRGMETVSFEEMIHLIEASSSIPQLIAGGSACNAIKGLAQLGHKTALVGMIGKDAMGQKVIDRLKTYGVSPKFSYSHLPTGHVACLITPDGQRTCRTFAGASLDMTAKERDSNLFHQAKWVHFEGYTLLSDQLPEGAMRLAKEAGAKISIDLGSFELVEAYRDRFVHLFNEFVDLVFANHEEALKFGGKNVQEACKLLNRFVEVSVVMLGEKGSLVGYDGTVKKIPVTPTKAIDTTGAGDLFASGFIHGQLSGRSIVESAKMGNLLGRTCVQIVGAEIPLDQWTLIKNKIKERYESN